GAQTATSGPVQLKLGEKIPSAAIRFGSTVVASHVSSGYSLSRPTAAIAKVYGEEAGYCTCPPELPPAPKHAMPWAAASSSFCSSACDGCSVPRLRLTTSISSSRQ